MDPLSITGSVIGVLGAASKIYSVAATLFHSWQDAPFALNGIVLEMTGLSACLKQLLPYVESRQAVARSQMMVVSVEQIVIVASSCVLAVSELQKILDGFDSSKPASTRTRLRWTTHEKRINVLRSRVEASTNSLNLILTIFACSSTQVTHESVIRLERKLECIQEIDQELFRKLEQDDLSVCLDQDASSSMSKLALSTQKKAVSIPVRDAQEPSSEDIGLAISDSNGSLDHTTEQNLSTSWVYIRANQNTLIDADRSASILSSATRWSFLSDISLGQISSISVLRLPIMPMELWCPEQYSEPKKSASDPNQSSLSATLTENGESSSSSHDPFKSYQRYSNGSIRSPSHQQKAATKTNENDARFTELKGAMAARGALRTRLKFRLPAALRGRAVSSQQVEIGSTRYEAIDLELAKARAELPRPRILLLGAGGSGKTTFLKQLQLLYGGGIAPKERWDYRGVIASNIVYSLQVLLRAFDEAGMQFDPPYSRCREEIENCDAPIDMLSPSLVSAIKGLWNEPRLQEMAEHKNGPAGSNIASFIQDIDRLGSDELPTDRDILMSRQRTIGIYNTRLEVGNAVYDVTDVGGSRVQRKKWVHLFETYPNSVTLFFVSLTGYDQCLDEDETTMQMPEALAIFESIVEHSWLRESKFVLVLSKRDLLVERLKTHPVKESFPDYEGPDDDVQEITDFFYSKFRDLMSKWGLGEDHLHLFVGNVTNAAMVKAAMPEIQHLGRDLQGRERRTVVTWFN